MKALFQNIVGWFLCINFELSAAFNKLPDFMVGKLLELLGVMLASVLVAIFATLFVDKKREVQKVRARLLDMRLEQYEEIRSFVEEQIKIAAFPENIDDVKNNFEVSGLSLEDNEECLSSRGIATEQKIGQALAELETITMNGLYILDDDVLGLLLQIKIYILNLNMFSTILRGYYGIDEFSGENNEHQIGEKIVSGEDVDQISEFYFHHLSIFLNHEYQGMIGSLQEMVLNKASKPKFERKEKNYRKIKTRQRLQDRALNKTILRNNFPQLILALASTSSAFLQETDDKRDKTIKGFFDYALDILNWQEQGTTYMFKGIKR